MYTPSNFNFIANLTLLDKNNLLWFVLQKNANFLINFKANLTSFDKNKFLLFFLQKSANLLINSKLFCLYLLLQIKDIFLSRALK